MERTLVILKPDAVQRGLIGPLLTRLERRGLRFAALKLMQISPELAARHYAIHKGKPFYEPLIEFITSGPVPGGHRHRAPDDGGHQPRRSRPWHHPRRFWPGDRAQPGPRLR